MFEKKEMGSTYDAGEEIGRDALKEWHVVREELGQVDVDDRTEHQNVLVLLGITMRRV